MKATLTTINPWIGDHCITESLTLDVNQDSAASLAMVAVIEARTNQVIDGMDLPDPELPTSPTAAPVEVYLDAPLVITYTAGTSLNTVSLSRLPKGALIEFLCRSTDPLLDDILVDGPFGVASFNTVSFLTGVDMSAYTAAVKYLADVGPVVVDSNPV